MKSQLSPSRGRRIKAMAQIRLARDKKKKKPPRLSSRFCIKTDLSTIERYALIFFSKCQFPIIWQSQSLKKSMQGKRFIIINGRTSTILENLQVIRSLGRFSLMMLSLLKEQQKNITARNLRRLSK